MKTYIYPIIAFLMLGVLTSCLNYEGPPLTEPRYTGEANITIADLRARFGHLTEPNTVTPIGSNFVLRARVAANDVSGNLFNQLYLQDETGGIIINIARSSLFNDFRIGQEVYIHLRELFITSFGGQIQIGFAGSPPRVPWEIFNHVAHRNGWPQADRITPRPITLDELNNLDAQGQSEIMATLVKLDNVFFEGGGEDAFVEDNRTTNRTLFDFDGNSIIVRTSSFASFSSDILPGGAGTVFGMLTKHNNDWQIILRTIDDLQDFERPIPPPPVSTLIFNETFGTPVEISLPPPSTTTLWPLIAQFAELGGFETTGIGAGAVYFASSGGRVDVRSNQPSNFSGASGSGNVMFNTTNGGTLYINDIATCGAQNLLLSFGTNQTNEMIRVAYRINGTDEWIPIPFTKTTTTWGLVRDLPIILPPGTNTIRLRFMAAGVQFGARIDDVRITTFDETGEPYIDPDNEIERTVFFNETFRASMFPHIPLPGASIAGYTFDNENVTFTDLSNNRLSIRTASTAPLPHVWFPVGVGALQISGIDTSAGVGEELILSFYLAADVSVTGNNPVPQMDLNAMTVEVNGVPHTLPSKVVRASTVPFECDQGRFFRRELSGIPAQENVTLVFRTGAENTAGLRLDNITIFAEAEE